MTNGMKESDLSLPVCDWLRGRGLVPYCEVPAQSRCVDVVGCNPEMLVAVELKLSLSMQVIRQAMINQNFADESWCAVATLPRKTSLNAAKRHQLGVLCVRNELRILFPAQRGIYRFEAESDRVRRQLAISEPGGVGGIPNPINDGPAQRVARLVAPLRRNGMKWPAIFKAVPNHYANARSMASVMLNYGPARAILLARVEGA